jgi:hypothetical protein
MEKKNKMFNLLMDEVKARCVESKTLGFDEKRTNDLLDDYILSDKVKKEYDIYVFSPYVDMVYDDTQYYKRLVGNPGDWTDDKDSYVIAISPSPVSDIKKSTALFSLRIFNYTDLDKELYYGSLIYNNEIFILDPNTHDEINKIKENLANSVEECTYILQNYYTTKRPLHLIYI